MRPDKASATAILVTTGLLVIAKSPGSSLTVPEEAVRLTEWLLVHYSPQTRWLFFALNQGWFHRVVTVIEAWTVPGILEHYFRRKEAIEALASENLDQPENILTILGAGFDTLALRLARGRPQLQAIEIDHPATQEWKKKSVAATGLGCPNLKFMAEDLAEAFPDLLKARRFWVAEGLLMYLSEVRVRKIFEAIHQRSLQGSQVAFTFMEQQRNGRVDFRKQSGWVNSWLKRRREPFAWGIRREGLEEFLAPLGFRPVAIADSVTREISRLNVGEYLALYEVV